MSLRRIVSLGLLACAGVAAIATPASAQSEVATQESAAATWSPKWTDDEIARVAGMLSGTWRTVNALPESESQGTTKVVMQIHPFPVADVSNALLVETSRSDAMDTPYRYAIFSLYRYKGQIRLRTYEFRSQAERQGVYAGTWAAPELAPAVSRADLIATLDVQLARNGDTYAGQTPYPYPTGEGGAVEMTSSVQLSATRLVTADRGFDAEGQVVWGADASSEWAWERIENPARVIRFDGGLVAVEYVRPEGEELGNGVSVHMHYSGYTGDGNRFDSSRTRERPFIFDYPAPGRLIEGWNVGLAGMTVGTKRRLIIPSALGYGEQGMPRANIPGNATLYFDIELMHIQKPEPAAEPAAEE